MQRQSMGPKITFSSNQIQLTSTNDFSSKRKNGHGVKKPNSSSDALVARVGLNLEKGIEILKQAGFSTDWQIPGCYGT